MSEWQPIESAPKNGTPIILGRPDYVEIGVWDGSYRCHKKAALGAWRTILGHDSRDTIRRGMVFVGGGPDDDRWPTHWMPLPPPPTATP